MKRHIMLASVLLLVSHSQNWGADQESAATRGRGKPLNKTASEDGSGYRKTWALVIGVNYTQRHQEGHPDYISDSISRYCLRPLANAEKDAKDFASVLVDYFGYCEGNTEETTLKLLTGPDATYTNIMAELASLCDSNKVTDQDSVVIFFAGHSLKLDGRRLDSAAILPYDIQLSGVHPVNNEVGLQSDLVDKLRRSAARHKLIILDSCYSGEIFNRIDLQAPIVGDERSTDTLFHQPVMQAIASCHAFQEAFDANANSPAKNSPFTYSLLRALRQLPARQDTPHPVTAHQVFRSVWLDLKGSQFAQSPECRNLAGDGEFRFIPARDANFAAFRPSLDEQTLLVLQGGFQGEWWFEDMPWFLPGLRTELIREIKETRDSGGFSLIQREQLLTAANGLLLRDRSEATNSTALANKRREWAKRLLLNHNKPEFYTILDELILAIEPMRKRFIASNPDPETIDESICGPEDIHLLALCLHARERVDEARLAYEQAVEGYANAQNQPGRVEVNRALQALCKADQAYFLLRSARQPQEAANTFHEADRLFGNDAPAAFRIFILSSEADAWLTINRWGEANDRLHQARLLAENVDPFHFLTAEICKRQAWASMIQWDIANGRALFQESNRILRQSLCKDDSATNPVSDRTAPLNKDNMVALPNVIAESSDVDTKVMYFHNLHGLAMAERFAGNSRPAAQMYRWLSRAIEKSIVKLAYMQGVRARDAEQVLTERLVNTLERLGDCNLFGDQHVVDYAEAFDDYRRALSRVHLLNPMTQNDQKAQLLYKQALALALDVCHQESSAEDRSLALRIATEADQLRAASNGTPSALLKVLSELTIPTVSLLCLTNSDNANDYQQAFVGLRDALCAFRDEHGPNLHRDQLELCLLASRVLLECGSTQDTFSKQEVATLLLSFCRMALRPDMLDNPQNPAGDVDSAKQYLRPYYDSAMQHLLSTGSSAIKHLLEIHHEATTGRRYPKEVDPSPMLVLCSCNKKCYLIYDFPRGPRSIVDISDDFPHSELHKAMTQSDAPLLQLPSEVMLAFATWRKTHRSDTQPVRCSSDDFGWMETSREIKLYQVATVRFPFQLPDGFVSTSPNSISSLDPPHPP